MDKFLEVLMRLLPTLLPIIVDCLDKPDETGRKDLATFAEHLTRIGVRSNDPVSYTLGYSLGCLCKQDNATYRERLEQLRGAVEQAKDVIDEAPNGPSVNV